MEFLNKIKIFIDLLSKLCFFNFVYFTFIILFFYYINMVFNKRVVSVVTGLAVILSVISPVVGIKAADFSELEAANKLAFEKVIVDKSPTPSEYRLDDTITRREMLKIMMKLSSVLVEDKCEGKFADLSAVDWGCKYAEAALAKGYIAPNTNFRPDDNVSKIEALKMIMQARGIAKDDAADWRVGYITAAVTYEILDTSGTYGSFTDYDTQALRGWIFVVTIKAMDADLWGHSWYPVVIFDDAGNDMDIYKVSFEEPGLMWKISLRNGLDSDITLKSLKLKQVGSYTLSDGSKYYLKPIGEFSKDSDSSVVEGEYLTLNVWINIPAWETVYLKIEWTLEEANNWDVVKFVLESSSDITFAEGDISVENEAYNDVVWGLADYTIVE